MNIFIFCCSDLISCITLSQRSHCRSCCCLTVMLHLLTSVSLDVILLLLSQKMIRFVFSNLYHSWLQGVVMFLWWTLKLFFILVLPSILTNLFFKSIKRTFSVVIYPVNLQYVVLCLLKFGLLLLKKFNSSEKKLHGLHGKQGALHNGAAMSFFLT